MSRGSKRLDPNQMQFDFDFDQRVEHYVEARLQIAEAIDVGTQPRTFENELELTIEIAMAAKQSIKEWGGSREQLVDGVNAYFGRSAEGVQADPPTCRNPMPAYLLVAIQSVTKHLHPANLIVSYEGAQVATGAELRQMTLGKLEETLLEMRRLKRELGKR
ncbi:MAG: hypothetical protein M0036_05125 [Desulfobacteraceae bacterium]|nr:hypothetical protein [Desulfobacteraceae bacterium]